MKLRLLSLIACGSILLVACGSSGGEKAGPTTTAEETTTTVAADGAPSTTSPPVERPVGDKDLAARLVAPTDFGAGFTYAPTSETAFSADVCAGSTIATKWTGTATMSVKSGGPTTASSGSETILTFAPGAATTFLTQLNEATLTCAKNGAKGAPVAVLTPLSGVGDEAYRLAVQGAAPTSAPAPDVDIVFARVGDDVVIVSSYSLQTLATPTLLATAVAKAKAG